MAIFKRDLTVTGLSQYSISNVVNRLKVGTNIILKHDPKNRYDSNATGVFFEGEQIGWIKKSENDFIAEVLKTVTSFSSPKPYRAEVAIFREGQPIWKSTFVLTVLVDIPNNMIPTALEDGWESNGKGVKVYENPSATTLAYQEGSTGFNPKYVIDSTTAAFNKTTKENNIMAKIADTNKQVATQAAFMEASRVLLNQATKMVAKQAPMFVKGYVDTPFGKLALANAMVMAVNQFRPNDARLVRLANAALGQAYQEVYKSFDIETFIEGFLNNETIKAALSAAGEPDVE